MARIRTIKPDFWEDESVAALSPLARLLFIGSWNMADDEGLLRWTADYLNASLLMYDNLSPARVKKLMDEIEALGMVFVYSAGKTRQTLGYVVNFRKHQRINRPQPSRLPPPSLQSPLTCEMYARRDGWTCHICKGPINAKKVPRYDGYDNDRIDWIRKNLGDEKFNFSPDHLIPRSKGGSDYPSNIGSSHVSCNKGRGNRPVPGSVPDSVNEDVNDAPPDSHPEGNGKGMEEEREMEEEGTNPSVELAVCEPQTPAPDRPPQAVGQVFEAWLASTGRTNQTLLDAKRRRLIDKALKDYPLDDVLDAVRGWHFSPHHRGENESRTVYNDLGLLLRDASHIEMFRDYKRQAPSTNGAPRTTPGEQAIDRVFAQLPRGAA